MRSETSEVVCLLCIMLTCALVFTRYSPSIGVKLQQPDFGLMRSGRNDDRSGFNL